MGRTVRAVVSVDGVGQTVLHGPTVHLRLRVFAFAGHLRIHLPPVQLALQCSPLPSISQPPLVHDKSHILAAHRIGLQLPPVQEKWHFSAA